MLFRKVGLNLLHSGHLIHMEWTAVIAVTAADTGIRLGFQLPVVLLRQMISGHGQVVIFVDQASIAFPPFI